ncbi:hypothetical protein Godav_021572 [Gossypium davidsonii]|uniref:Cohesin loading complex subunit SCC4 homolog n=1 Tax=Gossypium davidsonii TaxID=34287 RepID=A0A7J8R7F3_GOSDV|nr:hypothetical protein [Gossypium davidsonii]
MLLLQFSPPLSYLRALTNRLAKGLQIAHVQMGNLQLVSQYLTILGNLALALHDTGQAREILRSSLTLAKKLGDIPTQIWVLSVLTGLFQQLGERGNQMENDEYRRKKFDELQSRLADARSSIYHIELVITAILLNISGFVVERSLYNWQKVLICCHLPFYFVYFSKQIDKVKLQVQQFHEIDMKRTMAGESMRVNLDIPESVGLSTPMPVPSSSRLVDLDTGRRGKRKL